MDEGGKKILLLVEDESIIAMLESRQLGEFGYGVLTAGTGEEAVEPVRGKPVDLILMDIDLGPGIDGTEAAEKILRDRDIPGMRSELGKTAAGADSARTTEYRCLCKDGSHKVVEATVTNLLGDPVIQGILLSYHDISRHKAAV